MVDIYLCSLSTAYVTDDARKLFGIDLPKGPIGFNPKKAQVDENYRIDFLICFIFNTVKKIIRHSEKPLEATIHQYKKLSEYGISVEPLEDETSSSMTLQKIIQNIQLVANEKQKSALDAILIFARNVIPE